MGIVRFLLPLLLWTLALQTRADEVPDLLLEVRLGPHVLSDAVGGYQQDGDVLLPLGELARLLTIAIRTDPATGQASGYVLTEQRGFHLDLAARVLVQGAQRQQIDAGKVRRTADELYVPSRLLAAWLPVDLAVDISTLALTVTPREKLPLQARLERESRTHARMDAASADPGYPRQITPYRMARVPFIDQTLDLDLRGHEKSSTYTAYVTGDLLGAEAALFVRSGERARLTLARHDPGAGLLGPLHARRAQVGSVLAPGINTVTRGSTLGNGFLVSNRTLGHPARFDRHNLQGDLPPGWDVELYFNGALVGFQQSRPDGRYNFDDQPLIYGANEFRLVFHGPLGQVRIERQVFLLEQSMLAAGQFDYTAGIQHDEGGGARSTVQVEYGVHKRLSAGAAVVRMPMRGETRTYAQLGANAYFDNVIASATIARGGSGSLAQLAVKTRVRNLAVSASHARLDHFESELFPAQGDTIAARSEVRVDGQLGTLPLTLHGRRDTLESGTHNAEASARMSAFRFGTAISTAVRWQALAGATQADAQLQATRRVAGIGISGQLLYAIRPDPGVSTLAISADKHLDGGYLASAGVSRTFAEPYYRLNAGLTKSLGRFGMGLNAFYANRVTYGIGLQLFTAIGREPRGGRWMIDAAPMAASGSAAARVFLDKNGDGVQNAGDVPIPGAGFLINGGTHMLRTGADGSAYLPRMVPNQYTDIALDTDTLEDPQWQPLRKGVRIVPRAGAVAELDFAVGLTSEIDGTAYRASKGSKRAAGDLEIELVNAEQAVVASTRTGADGYYILPAIPPGRYQLRVSPAQLARLGLAAPPAHTIEIGSDANFVNGKNFVLGGD